MGCVGRGIIHWGCWGCPCICITGGKAPIWNGGWAGTAGLIWNCGISEAGFGLVGAMRGII
jgi:hypothetical protein